MVFSLNNSCQILPTSPLPQLHILCFALSLGNKQAKQMWINNNKKRKHQKFKHTIKIYKNTKLETKQMANKIS